MHHTTHHYFWHSTRAIGPGPGGGFWFWLLLMVLVAVLVVHLVRRSRRAG
ncbi:hypothetical protein ACFYNO_03800 [Kitasatospora sp. NPDC006697]